MGDIDVGVIRDHASHLPNQVEGVDLQELLQAAGNNGRLSESEAQDYVYRVQRGEAGSRLSSEVRQAIRQEGVQGYMRSVERARNYINTNYNYTPTTGENVARALGITPGLLLVYCSDEGSWGRRWWNQFSDGIQSLFD